MKRHAIPAELTLTSPCWVDPGVRQNKKSYAYFYWRNPVSGRKYYHAHAWALVQALGRDIRPGYHAAHRCANPACWNGAHLYEATPSENEADKRVAHAPQPVEWHLLPRAPKADHRALYPVVRARHAAGESLKAIARDLGLPYSSAQWMIRKRDAA